MTTRDRPAGDVDYEQHGRGYAVVRQPDPRIAARVHAALGSSRTVLNVGAGAGSYEPADRYVLAVEPSATMRAQRPVAAAPAVDATAERLPFDDNSFDAAMATVTIHQWGDVEQGLREMRRVSRGPVVVLTVDAPVLQRFWLADYFPEVIALDQARFPTLDQVTGALAQGSAEVSVDVVPVPVDCTDGFGEAFYARPKAFLRPEVRAATSGFLPTDPGAVQRGLERLEDDLASGAWDQAYGRLREQAEHNGALRLISPCRARRAPATVGQVRLTGLSGGEVVHHRVEGPQLGAGEVLACRGFQRGLDPLVGDGLARGLHGVRAAPGPRARGRRPSALGRPPPRLHKAGTGQPVAGPRWTFRQQAAPSVAVVARAQGGQ